MIVNIDTSFCTTLKNWSGVADRGLRSNDYLYLFPPIRRYYLIEYFYDLLLKTILLVLYLKRENKIYLAFHGCKKGDELLGLQILPSIKQGQGFHHILLF
jgi:hypothetical protein